MKKPDTLLTEIEKSIFVKALVISIIAHIVLLAVTSVSLFIDWGTYGIHSPSYINAVKAKENKEAEAERRKKELEEKAAAASKGEKAAGEVKPANTAPAKEKAPDAKEAPQSASSAKEESVTPPEIEPLPPKKEFQLGDDLSLD